MLQRRSEDDNRLSISSPALSCFQPIIILVKLSPLFESGEGVIPGRPIRPSGASETSDWFRNGRVTSQLLRSR